MKSSFDLIKESVSLLDIIERYSGQGTRLCGTDTYELEDKACPYCDHSDCFRINMGEDKPYFNCFSCEESGDAISFVQKRLNLKKPYDAVVRIAKDFKIALPKSTQSPQQQILNAATDYYENLLFTDETKYECLGGLTPLEYQVQVRKHDPEILKRMRVGWSDGKMCKYLDSIGFTEDAIKAAGVLSSRIKLGDYLPSNSFIYSHAVRGQTSHFTQKGFTNLSYQLKNDHKLNNWMFYNQDSVSENNEIVIVEGENDLLAVIRGGWTKGIIATIGQLSSDQVAWLKGALVGKTIITCFDSDDTGGKYRNKIAALSVGNTIKIEHMSVPKDKYKDIDEYIKDGHTFEDALTSHLVHVAGGVEIKDGITKFDSINVFEKDKCYYKVVVKNQEPEHVPISNFIITMKHILVINDKRHRVVNVTRSDDLTSGDLMIDSETKVTLRLFKRRMAECIDGFFYGTEKDLEEMWQHILMKDGEYLVDIPKEVGRVHMNNWNGCWIFRNVLIDRLGKLHFPDDQGVYWPRGKGKGRRGIRAQSITSESISDTSQEGIPSLTVLDSSREYDEAVKFFLDRLIANFGNKTQAITTAGWCMANAFSDPIFNYYKFFPFPFIWGKFGGGKSGILKILMSIYNMEEFGMTTVGSLKSGVGFERKMAYYCSLPLALDEVRNDPETRANYMNFRKWFNRQGRSLGSRDDAERIQEREVKSTIIFGGEEVIEESATRSRLIPIRLARMDDPARETEKTYADFMKAMEGGVMSSIGLHWIQLSCETDNKELFEEISRIKQELKVLCPTARTRTLDIYAIVGFFGEYLTKTYYPDFDYITGLSTIVEDDKQDQDTSDVVAKFLETLDGLIASKERALNRHHVFVKNDHLCIWYADVYRIANPHLRALAEGNTISSNAIRKAMEEEPYYAGNKKIDVGKGNDYRRHCIMLDLSKAPESVRNIATASAHLE